MIMDERSGSNTSTTTLNEDHNNEQKLSPWWPTIPKLTNDQKLLFYRFVKDYKIGTQLDFILLLTARLR
jgi:hypothetical protein